MNEPIGERIAVLESKVERIEQDLSTLLTDVKHIRSLLDQARGGWKTMMVIGGAAASLGAGVAWLLGNLKTFFGGAT